MSFDDFILYFTRYNVIFSILFIRIFMDLYLNNDLARVCLSAVSFFSQPSHL